MSASPVGGRAASVRDLVESQAALRPDATYFIASETRRALTFGELRASCNRVAALLAREGAGPGAHVSIVMPNGLATLRILLGAMAGGYCVNPVNLLSQPEQMRYVLDVSRAQEKLGWKAEVPLDDGIERTVAAFLK